MGHTRHQSTGSRRSAPSSPGISNHAHSSVGAGVTVSSGSGVLSRVLGSLRHRPGGVSGGGKPSSTSSLPSYSSSTTTTTTSTSRRHERNKLSPSASSSSSPLDKKKKNNNNSGRKDKRGRDKNNRRKENNDSNSNWIAVWKITHFPDRPQRDKQRDAKLSDEEYLEKILRMQDKNQRRYGEAAPASASAATTKTTTTAAADAAAAVAGGGDRGSNSNSNDNSNSNMNNTSITSRRRAPTLNTTTMTGTGGPNFSYPSLSPRSHRTSPPSSASARTEWLSSIDHEAVARYARRPSSPMSPSTMTILVGLERGFSLLRRPSVVLVDEEEECLDEGNEKKEKETKTMPMPMPMHMPLPSVLRSPRSPRADEPARRAQKQRVRHRRASSSSNHQNSPATPTQTQTQAQKQTLVRQIQTKAKAALRDSVTSIYENAYLNPSTPSLILNSAPAVSPPPSPSLMLTSPLPPSLCPMCRNPLREIEEKTCSLCGDCRQGLLPRESVFFGPGSGSGNEKDEDEDEDEEELTPKVMEASYETFRRVVDTNKKKNNKNKENEGGSRVIGVVDELGTSFSRTVNTTILSSTYSNHNSDSNKDNKNKFELQPAPQGRKNAGSRKIPPAAAIASRQASIASTTSSRKSSSSLTNNSHISFQLAGWNAPLPSPSDILIMTPRGAPLPESGTGHGSSTSAPEPDQGPLLLLEPKTFNANANANLLYRSESDGSSKSPWASSSHFSEGSSSGSNSPSSSTARTSPSPPPAHTNNQNQNQNQNQNHNRNRPVGNMRSRAVFSEAFGVAGGNDENENGIAYDDEEDIYREIESIIDLYLQADEPDGEEGERRKADAVAQYYAADPPAIELFRQGFTFYAGDPEQNEMFREGFF